MNEAAVGALELLGCVLLVTATELEDLLELTERELTRLELAGLELTGFRLAALEFELFTLELAELAGADEVTVPHRAPFIFGALATPFA